MKIRWTQIYTDKDDQLQSFYLFETRSSPESLAATLRGFTFYVTHAIRSIHL